ncbi:DUF2939 domain-containing protein [Comamonas serinivorans]|nr:DUF2939 domain-containing protein [Comamonas serinivorans]
MTIKTVVVAGVLAAAGVWGGAPYYTAHQIKQAVERGDAAALAKHVDFDRVRASLKRQLTEGVTRHLPEGARSGVIADLGGLLASRATDAALQALITPEGVTDLLAGRMVNPLDRPSADQGAPEPAPTRDADTPRPSAGYVGWDQFQVQLPAKGRNVNLMLTREGVLSWRLTDIELPDLL